MRHQPRDRLHMCHLCGSSYLEAVNLRVHLERCGKMRSHPLLRRRLTDQSHLYKCHFCAKKFNSLATIMKHYDERHADSPQIKHVCRFCNELLPSMDHMDEHISPTSHSLKCLLCSTTLRCNGRLDKHKKMHDNPHICRVGVFFFFFITIFLFREICMRLYRSQLCGAEFISELNMNRHIASVHEQIKRFRCDDCNREFYESSSLIIHKTTQRHKEKVAARKHSD